MREIKVKEESSQYELNRYPLYLDKDGVVVYRNYESPDIVSYFQIDQDLVYDVYIRVKLKECIFYSEINPFWEKVENVWLYFLGNSNFCLTELGRDFRFF